MFDPGGERKPCDEDAILLRLLPCLDGFFKETFFSLDSGTWNAVIGYPYKEGAIEFSRRCMKGREQTELTVSGSTLMTAAWVSSSSPLFLLCSCPSIRRIDATQCAVCEPCSCKSAFSGIEFLLRMNNKLVWTRA